MPNTILIVDDVYSNRLVLEKILSREAYQIHTASSAQDALAVCKKYTIDLILLDINMPQMNGFELAQELRRNQDTDEIHFIFITGIRNNRVNELKGLKLGAVDYIEKPIDREVLVSKVYTHLDSINKEKQLRLKNLELQQQIAHSKQLEQELSLSAAVFEQASNAILITDKDQIIIKINKAFSTITGYSEEEALGQTPKLLSSGKHDKRYYQKMWQDLNTHGVWSGEIWNKRKNGNVYPELQNITTLLDDDGKPRNYIAIFSDLSQHIENQAQIEKLAHYDTLTKLANKVLFNSYLSKSITTAKQRNSQGALLFVDINDFKKYNHTLGLEFGDQLLIKFSKLLISIVSTRNVLISRYGADEFTIWIQNNDQPSGDIADDAKNLAAKIQDKLASPINIDGYDVIVNCSIGISLFPVDANTGSSLVRKAETAMYQAKTTGSHQHQFFQRQMEESARHKLHIEDELRHALANNDLELYYQPQVEMHSNKVIGAEALIRWNHKELGFISPADFIPIAEKSALIVDLGNQVISQACQQIKCWEQQGLFEQLGSISINISSLQFEYPLFIESLQQAINTSAIDPRHLVIELTETALVNDHKIVTRRLEQIKAMGCSISIDDFGTGYSSLRYLSTFPVDVLKIDKCFVDHISTNIADRAVIAAIVSMGKMLNAKIIVEGVESAEQLEVLLTYNCDAFQGYLFSPAINTEKFEQLVLNS